MTGNTKSFPGITTLYRVLVPVKRTKLANGERGIGADDPGAPHAIARPRPADSDRDNVIHPMPGGQPAARARLPEETAHGS